MQSNSKSRFTIPAPIQIIDTRHDTHHDLHRPLTSYPKERLPSIREMNLLESTRPHTSTLLTLADTSLNQAQVRAQTQSQAHYQSMINMRRLSVPTNIGPPRSGCDPIRGRPTINKTGAKSRTKPAKQTRSNPKQNLELNSGLFDIPQYNCNVPQLVPNQTMYFQNDQHPAPWTHPGTLFPRVDVGPLSAPIRINGFQEAMRHPARPPLPPLSSPIESTPSRHNSDPISLTDSKVSHRLKEQQRRDSFSHGMKLLDEKLDQLEGAAPLPKRKKLDTIHLAYQKLSQQDQEIEFLKSQLHVLSQQFPRP